MSADNNPVKPTPFQAAAPAPASDEQVAASQVGTPAWVLPALGGLILVAALVVFWLPSLVSPPATETVTEPTSASSDTRDEPAPPTSKPASEPAGEEASPWSDAQLARLRKESQDVLAELLDVQYRLEERGVTRWAAEPFEAAVTEAQAADDLYKSREFEQATAGYRSALEKLLALEAGIPAALEEQLQRGRDAIEAGDVQTLAEALELGELLEPGHPELAELRARGEVLPELIARMEEAAGFEDGGDLATAEASLQAAVALDGQHQRAASELARVSDAWRQQQFNDAMSDGYIALDENRFDAARQAFRRADKLLPGSTEASSALQEVSVAETASRLGRLQQKGGRLEQSEDWGLAVKAYQEALEIDGNLLFAREGLARAEPRARLDKQFRQALDDPNRLSDVAVAEATGTLLAQARRIQPMGPVLAKQISELEVVLEKANKPLSVTLRSDGATEVIVYKVARLGTFDERQLTLRPGTYTAVGTRNGFRDVRQTFTLSHDQAVTPVTIACTEPI
jgi:tetratricopeptide (TPR) repeat protein